MSEFIAPVNSDKLIAMFYLILDKQGLLPVIFPEGVPDIQWFIDRYLRPENNTLGCFDEKGDLVGMGWINTIDSNRTLRKAEVGIAMLKKVSPRLTLKLGRKLVDWGFETLGLTSMYGTTPEHNKPALAYVKRLGFTLHGPIPAYTLWNNMLSGVYISSLTRPEWEENHERSKEV